MLSYRILPLRSKNRPDTLRIYFLDSPVVVRAGCSLPGAYRCDRLMVALIKA